MLYSLATRCIRRKRQFNIALDILFWQKNIMSNDVRRALHIRLRLALTIARFSHMLSKSLVRVLNDSNRNLLHQSRSI
jgi:hypothetical protein